MLKIIFNPNKEIERRDIKPAINQKDKQVASSSNLPMTDSIRQQKISSYSLKAKPNGGPKTQAKSLPSIPEESKSQKKSQNKSAKESGIFCPGKCFNPILCLLLTLVQLDSHNSRRW
jgi:hypothetical protein